jgi:predicted Zn-dependent protease
MNGPVDPQSAETQPTPRGSRRPRRRSTSGRIFRFLGWATVLALALGAGARPAYRFAKGWNARGKAREVESRVAARDLDGTFDLVKSAVRLAPDDPEVLRAAARFLALGRAEESVAYWQKYLAVAGPRADARERSEYVEAALMANRLDLSRPMLTELVRASPTNPVFLRLLVRQHLLLRDIPRATRTARFLLSQEPSNRRNQLLLGTVLLEFPPGPPREEGRRLVWSLVADGGEDAVEAALLLSGIPDLKRSEADTVLRRLSSQDNPPLPVRLALTAIRMRFPTDGQKSPVDELLSATPPGADRAETFQVCEWLLRNAASRLPDWLPEGMARTNLNLQMIRCEGLASAGRWKELQSILSDEKPGLTPGVVKYFRGRSSFAAGRRDEAEAEYRAAVESAGNDRRWLPVLARTAEAQGMTNAALAAWETLLGDSRHSVEAARQVSRMARSMDDLTLFHRSVRRLAGFFSADESFTAEAAILDLLFEEETAKATKTLQGLHESQPDRIEWRIGLALARLRSADPSSGLALLEEAGFDFDRVSPRAKAVYVALLGASGQRESARRLARRVPIDLLHRQEKPLVAPWLTTQ